MPTYEYRCHRCGKTFLVIQGIKEDKLTVHEGCGGELERLISGGRLMLTERKSGRPESDEFDAPPPGGWGDEAFDGGGPGGGLDDDDYGGGFDDDGAGGDFGEAGAGFDDEL